MHEAFRFSVQLEIWKIQIYYHAREVLRYRLRLKELENIISWMSRYEMSKKIVKMNSLRRAH